MADTGGRALYLAWRPRRFDDVVGQHHVVQTIRNAVRNGTIAHAYLFSGPRGTGKTSMARLLFKAVNCLRPIDGGPCETCAICTSANEGRALDLIEMDAASNRGIDDIRDLRDKINYAPADARYRVYILDEAHQLTQAAWDALLKTLEEPPPHAILVLATTESHKVPATVVSRCQRFDFHRISAVDIRERLAMIAQEEGVEVESTVLSWLARAARGGLRDAISLLDQLRAFAGDRIDAASARDVLGLAGLETVRPFLEALQEDRPGDALEELNGSLERGADLRVYAADVVTYLRALLLLRYGASTTLRTELPAEEVTWLEEQATSWEAGRLRRLVGGFGEAMARFRDPTQLLIQIELTLLGGWDAPDTTVAGRSTARASRPHSAERASPSRSTTPDEPRSDFELRVPPRRTAPGEQGGRSARERPAGFGSSTAPIEAPLPGGGSTAADGSAGAAVTRGPASRWSESDLDVAPPRSAATGAAVSEGTASATAQVGGASRASAATHASAALAAPAPARPPAPMPEDYPLDEDSFESDEAWTPPELLETSSCSASAGHTSATDNLAPSRESTEREPAVDVSGNGSSTNGASGASPLADGSTTGGTPAVPGGVPGDGKPRSKWDGMGVGGTTVRAHWETDDDDDTSVVRIVVDAPPPPPVPTAGYPSGGRDSAVSTGTPEDVAAGTPALRFDDLHARWSEIRDELAGTRLDRIMLKTCEIVGVEGQVLVVQIGRGHTRLLEGKQRELKRDLAGILGCTADLCFIDDSTPYTPPDPMSAPPTPSLPTQDPVIQAGLRYFGGPLERIDD
ncbi:MAG: DNA polymerase III subunit gamma/tau [Chloroflexi bacterium]|nr:DNA polymerase III subunit gamma/tau [Chloroflexota bacterium]